MQTLTLTLFLFAALSLIVTPSPTTMVVSARSIGQGKTGAISALGI